MESAGALIGTWTLLTAVEGREGEIMIALASERVGPAPVRSL